MIYRLKNNGTLIDDSFSANPQATIAAIDVLSEIGKNKIAVLGNMLELGSYTKKGHEIVGAYAAKKKIHHLLTYGGMAKHIRNSAIRSGFSSARSKHFTDRTKMHNYLKRIYTSNSTILVKGSNKMKMNRTVSFSKESLG